MDIRKFSLAAVTIAALAPAIAGASPERTALDACASAFASSLSTAAAAASAPAFKVDYRGVHYTDSVTEMYSRGYSFHLFAKTRTGARIAQALCETDYHGAVIALSPLPLEAPPPTLAAQN
jgi:hypothetical protein